MTAPHDKALVQSVLIALRVDDHEPTHEEARATIKAIRAHDAERGMVLVSREPTEAGRLIEYLFQTTENDKTNTNGTRIRDICFTTFMRAREPNPDDGGKTDWLTDTLPTVDESISEMRDRLRAALAQEGE